jgi:activator of HSP90 ATPase
MTDHIHQELVFVSARARIYEALTDAALFSMLCGGAPREFVAAAGGAFSCFGGMILGRNSECAPGERLVQAWRVKTWDPGVYSIVRFELRPEGKSTRVLLDHAGFPEGQGEHLAKGWHANYWEPMRKALA